MACREDESARVARRLFGLFLEEGDQIITVLGLLEATEGHLGAGNVLLRVLEVLELVLLANVRLNNGGMSYQGVLVPGDALLLVGVGV